MEKINCLVKFFFLEKKIKDDIRKWVFFLYYVGEYIYDIYEVNKLD